MRYHVVDTITNGVLLTEANIGQRVEWVSVMTDLVTGKHHRTVHCSGRYVGSWPIGPDGWVYAMFRDGYIGDRFQAELGGPLARFRMKGEWTF